MTRYLATWAAAATMMVALDLLWLGVIAKPLYQQGIGHLMAPQPNIGVAVLFYALFIVGLMVFAIVPHAASGWSKLLLMAALFGFFTYATYDLTNLATLRDWSVKVVLADMAWGVVVSMAAAAAGKAVWDRLGA